MFGNFFNRKKPAPPEENDWESKLIWLPAGHANNPFPEEVLDCRAVALNFLSMTKDESVARTFNSLRNSDGRDLKEQLPKDSLRIDCKIQFPYNGQHNDGPMFLAREMEDKWDFFTYSNLLYVRRSWTGQLTHVAELEYSSDTVIVKKIHCETNTVFKNPNFAVAQLHFLIVTHLGHTLIPFPILPDFPKSDAKSIALMGFSSYGRRAQFGQYIKNCIADSSQVPPP
jgi:hypothetical protein